MKRPTIPPSMGIPAIRRVIEQREVRIVYQPVVDLRSGSTFAYEALVRSSAPEFTSPPLLFDAADAIDAPAAAPRPIAPPSAPQGLVALDRAETGPRMIFPPDGAAVQVDAFGPASRGLVLAATGKGLNWYLDGVALSADPVSGSTIWRPSAAGFYRLTVVDAAGRKASAKVRIKGG